MEIETIKPQIFKDEEVRAFFTLKNENLYAKDREIKGLNLGFNTREAPEIITANRHHLFKTVNIDPRWIAFANQVHGNRVKVVTTGGTFANTDALITQVPGLALAIQVADCAAILISDDKSKTIAAVHAGWRGAAGDIVPRTWEKMHQLGATPGTSKAFISPCISLANFEVGGEVAEQFPDQFVDYENFTKPHINLKEFLAYQLRQVGLSPGHVEIHPGDTIRDEMFYSYRRENDDSGRMMAVIERGEDRF